MKGPLVMASAFWHPFADMSKVSKKPFIIEKSDDVYVWDKDGKRYLDATASLWYMNVGHGRKEIIDAAHRQAEKLPVYSTFGDFSNEPAETLAEMLSERAPEPGSKIFFAGGGGEAVETAAKLARRYFSVLGKPEKLYIIHRHHSYHGTNGLGTSLAGIPANKVGFGPMVRESEEVPTHDAEALEASIVRLGAENVAAFIVEPVIGAGGVYPPQPGYLEAVAQICERHDVLLIVDAVICGFGRLGGWFSPERFGVKPDLITFAKGVTSGYLPLGGVVVSPKVAAPFWDEPGNVFRHGPTYAGHPTCCAAGIANISILEREGLIERGAQLEEELLQTLQVAENFSIVSEVRGGVGLLGAVELSPTFLKSQPQGVGMLQDEMRSRGVITRTLSTSVAFSPPLTIEKHHLEELSDALSDSLRALEKLV